jgi:hypothetical protein
MSAAIASHESDADAELSDATLDRVVALLIRAESEPAKVAPDTSGRTAA